MNEYKIPAAPGEAELIEKRSRFIGRCVPVNSEAEATGFISEVRAKHRDASHNVYAWRVREGALGRHSDDGEPSGTAGMPLLEVFLKQGLTNFCAVVTRYFGGVLLGAGGLTRAYAKAGALALEVSGVAVMRPWVMGRAVIPYSLYDILLRALEAEGAAGIETAFSEDAAVSFSLPEEKFEPFRAALTDLTSGRAAAERLGSAYFPG